MNSMHREEPTVAFFGTPRFAVQVLDELEKARLMPDVVITAPDRPVGRGLTLTPPPVKTWAEERDIPVIQPESLKKGGEELAVLMNSEWDLFLVAAYGKILPKEILALPEKGSLNVHPSLLPKFRGASPVESQIVADEKTVGVSIMLMDEELDHGPILSQASITPEAWPLTASVLEALLARAGGELLAETAPLWLAGTITPEEQKHGEATYTKKLQKADGEIALSDDPYRNYLKFCAYEGWPGTYFFEERGGEKIRVKVTDATYENGSFVPLKVIPEGRKEIAYKDFLNKSAFLDKR